MTDLTSVMISQTAHSILLDSIVVDVHDGGSPVRQPGTALLLDLGLAGLFARRQHTPR